MNPAAPVMTTGRSGGSPNRAITATSGSSSRAFVTQVGVLALYPPLPVISHCTHDGLPQRRELDVAKILERPHRIEQDGWRVIRAEGTDLRFRISVQRQCFHHGIIKLLDRNVA